MSLYEVKSAAVHKFALTIITIFLTTACVTVDVNLKNQKNTNTPPLVSIVDSPGFEAFKLTLSHIVKERNPGTDKLQHFYVAKYSENEVITYMFWQEMKLLWIMSPGGLDEESWLGVRYPSSGQLIDLQNGVVSTDDEVGSSSYLVTKKWAAKRLFEAFIKGDLIIVNQ